MHFLKNCFSGAHFADFCTGQVRPMISIQAVSGADLKISASADHWEEWTACLPRLDRE